MSIQELRKVAERKPLEYDSGFAAMMIRGMDLSLQGYPELVATVYRAVIPPVAKKYLESGDQRIATGYIDLLAGIAEADKLITAISPFGEKPSRIVSKACLNSVEGKKGSVWFNSHYRRIAELLWYFDPTLGGTADIIQEEIGRAVKTEEQGLQDEIIREFRSKMATSARFMLELPDDLYSPAEKAQMINTVHNSLRNILPEEAEVRGRMIDLWAEAARSENLLQDNEIPWQEAVDDAIEDVHLRDVKSVPASNIAVLANATRGRVPIVQSIAPERLVEFFQKLQPDYSLEATNSEHLRNLVRLIQGLPQGRRLTQEVLRFVLRYHRDYLTRREYRKEQRPIDAWRDVYDALAAKVQELEMVDQNNMLEANDVWEMVENTRVAWRNFYDPDYRHYVMDVGPLFEYLLEQTEKRTLETVWELIVNDRSDEGDERRRFLLELMATGRPSFLRETTGELMRPRWFDMYLEINNPPFEVLKAMVEVYEGVDKLTAALRAAQVNRLWIKTNITDRWQGQK